MQNWDLAFSSFSSHFKILCVTGGPVDVWACPLILRGVVLWWNSVYAVRAPLLTNSFICHDPASYDVDGEVPAS